ncbi:hypothetical protein [Tuwongella immobilis]|uniref:Glycosyltransferase RgtA/B/C/D-like domain-containing protein n=1 Tax=Tuwongella immobilis TaxID=692036 RepID=A0A6C2YJ30_9BACT|nr:hypothetical protein [Tuwongella immobilis]VIP01291.1 unnamed protein product [Tuwongella immobilis]VTR98008.1 unnamed protein product [Tuwongella immobilis]
MKPQIWALGLVVLLGAMLRLVWPAEMEYKQDEAWSFEMTQRVGTVDPFPWTGMPSSTGMPNPGLSIWQFLGLAWLFDLRDPVALAQAVQVINVLGLILFAGIVWRIVPAGEREIWFWALALAAVNPLAMIIQRKIWPISTMPPLSLLMLVGFCRRDLPLGAFTWGMLTALLAQLHLGSAIFAVGFLLAAWILRRQTPIAWRAWFLGSLIGSLPALPWLWVLLNPPTEPPTTHLAEWFQSYVAQKQQTGTIHWHHLFEFKFFLRYCVEPLGLGWGYLLGRDFNSYLQGPMLGGVPTHLTAVAWMMAILAGGFLAIRAVRIAGMIWGNRAAGVPIDRQSWTLAGLLAGLLAGVTITLLMVPIHRHYLNGLFPLTFLFISALGTIPPPGSLPLTTGRLTRWLVQPKLGRIALATLVIAQLTLSTTFLLWIHQLPRPVAGEYGISYHLQRERGRIFPQSMIDIAAEQAR